MFKVFFDLARVGCANAPPNLYSLQNSCSAPNTHYFLPFPPLLPPLPLLPCLPRYLRDNVHSLLTTPMAESLTISNEPLEHLGMDFARLRQEGIQSLERLAGTIWTDYNTHDPGITILEVLCYGITDLSYRLSFEMKDVVVPTIVSNGQSPSNGEADVNKAADLVLSFAEPVRAARLLPR